MTKEHELESVEQDMAHIQNRMADLVAERALIREQISVAKTKKFMTGEKTDPGLFAARLSELDKKTRLITHLHIKITNLARKRRKLREEMKKESDLSSYFARIEKQEEQKTRERFFVDIAKRRLPDQIFNALWQEALLEMGERERMEQTAGRQAGGVRGE